MADKTGGALTDQERAWLEPAYRFDRDGWVFVHIEGDGFERGFQHGYLLSAEIAEVLRVARFLTEWATGNDFAYFSEMAMQMYADKIDQEFIDEMTGIAAGATKAGVPLSFAEILAWNANVEMTESWWPLIASDPPQPNAKPHRCSAFIANGSYTTDGQIVLAHNTWDTYPNAAHTRIALDIKPSKGHRIMMQTSPGYIHSGTDFFVIDSGIIGAETTISGFEKYDVNGAPECFRVRKAMQYGDDIDQWMDIMKERNNGGYANSWLLGDIHSNEIVRFELGLKFAGVTRKDDGYFWGCNIISDLKIRNQESEDVGYSDITQDASRRVRWNALLNQHKGAIEPGLAKDLLADHYDVTQKCDNPSTRSLCGHFDIDPVAFTSWGFPPFYPFGAADGKVTSSALAREMSFHCRIGHPCGTPFSAKSFLEAQPQFDWLDGYLSDMPTQPWTAFASWQTSHES